MRGVGGSISARSRFRTEGSQEESASRREAGFEESRPARERRSRLPAPACCSALRSVFEMVQLPDKLKDRSRKGRMSLLDSFMRETFDKDKDPRSVGRRTDQHYAHNLTVGTETLAYLSLSTSCSEQTSSSRNPIPSTLRISPKFD